MAHKFIQSTTLSNAPLKGFFAYKDIFQIFPHDVPDEPFHYDYPLTLEVKIDDDVYPDRTSNFWHRDVWEEERYENIRRRSEKRKMDPKDGWVQTYQDHTKSLRVPAILAELRALLTVFSHYRFFIYDNKQRWFIPINKDQPSSDKSVWGQPGFISDFSGEIDHFTGLTFDPVEIINFKEHAKRFRDAIYASEEHRIIFHEHITFLFDKYFSLPEKEKTAYFMACHLYNQALFFSKSIPSLSMVAGVMAIEKMVNYETDDEDKCDECSAPKAIEKCNTCGTPIYRLRSRFREFMATFSHPDYGNLYRDMYDTRSRLAHGGVLREDLFDTGFYAGDKDEEDQFRRNSLIVVHDALIHWLLKFNP